MPLGFKVARALSGNDGLELMNSRGHIPDLILLDVEMPTESGYEVCIEPIIAVFDFMEQMFPI